MTLAIMQGTRCVAWAYAIDEQAVGRITPDGPPCWLPSGEWLGITLFADSSALVLSSPWEADDALGARPPLVWAGNAVAHGAMTPHGIRLDELQNYWIVRCQDAHTYVAWVARPAGAQLWCVVDDEIVEVHDVPGEQPFDKHAQGSTAFCLFWHDSCDVVHLLWLAQPRRWQVTRFSVAAPVMTCAPLDTGRVVISDIDGAFTVISVSADEPARAIECPMPLASAAVPTSWGFVLAGHRADTDGHATRLVAFGAHERRPRWICEVPAAVEVWGYGPNLVASGEGGSWIVGSTGEVAARGRAELDYVTDTDERRQVSRRGSLYVVDPCAPGTSEAPTAALGEQWARWRTVGCGVESLHDVLARRGVEVTLDVVLAEALDADGYSDDLGWRHHALVEVGMSHAVAGEVYPPLTTTDVLRAAPADDWIISVRAPEQFGEMTHLVHVRRAGAPSEDRTDPGADAQVEVFWPQGHLEFGERFRVPAGWLATRMTGRGMHFPGPALAE